MSPPGAYFKKVLFDATVFNVFLAIANFPKRQVLGPVGILKHHFVFCVFVSCESHPFLARDMGFSFMTLTKFSFLRKITCRSSGSIW